MKIRTAFVSNSSSCSFCIGKNYMTDYQIKKFKEFCDEIDSYIYEDRLYFLGEIEQSEMGDIGSKLVELGVNTNHFCMMQ